MTTQGMSLTLFGRTDTGKTRTKNEDAFVISDLTDAPPIHSMTSPVSLPVDDRGVLIAVSDGMGGAQAGDVASSLVLSALRHGMTTVHASSADVALRVIVEEANQHVYNTAQSTGREGMGATLTAVLFHGIYAYVAEVGDSRAYLLRAGRLAQLTRDQSYVQQLVDAGALTPEQSETSQYKNIILQAMGLKPTVEVAMRRISLRRQDRIVVCSDGLWGTLKDQEMINVLLGAATLDAACAQLVETAVEHGGEDDVTVVLGSVDGEGVPVITEPERLSLETTKVFDPA